MNNKLSTALGIQAAIENGDFGGDFYLGANTMADGVTKLKGHCKFCDLPIEGKGFCDDTCRELYHKEIGKMTKEEWQELAKRDKSILIGY